MASQTTRSTDPMRIGTSIGTVLLRMAGRPVEIAWPYPGPAPETELTRGRRCRVQCAWRQYLFQNSGSCRSTPDGAALASRRGGEVGYGRRSHSHRPGNRPAAFPGVGVHPDPQQQGRDRPHTAPAWLARLDTMSPWTAAVVAAIAQPWTLVAAGAVTIAEARLSGVGDWFALARVDPG